MHFAIRTSVACLILAVSAIPAAPPAAPPPRDEWCCSPIAPGDGRLDPHIRPIRTNGIQQLFHARGWRVRKMYLQYNHWLANIWKPV
ncbi:hypothetical protein LshimejAT787_0312040 [Lyophyllum shimeji]|uniref:Uncharacterized protein n=1 Tax=Lyophyllum shimeji TaxID=47721 RepID=A0A9P3PKC7_LYOSH|nr:hypothetical protein LshimejAT787_0312040 [Lyophyllum shimeji]